MNLMSDELKESSVWKDQEFKLQGTDIPFQYLEILRNRSLNLIYWNINQLAI